jgi:MFS family permease
MLFTGIALWGLHMGMTQGILATLITDVAPTQYRATAFGMFNLLSGAGLLAASALAGWLWDRQGPAATFWAGALIALVCALCIPLFTGKAAPSCP